MRIGLHIGIPWGAVSSGLPTLTDFTNPSEQDYASLAERVTGRVSAVNGTCDAGTFHPLAGTVALAADQYATAIGGSELGATSWNVGAASAQNTWRGTQTPTWRDAGGAGRRVEIQATGLTAGQSYGIWLASYIGVGSEPTMIVQSGAVWQRPELTLTVDKINTSRTDGTVTTLARQYGLTGSMIVNINLHAAAIFLGNWVAPESGVIKIQLRRAGATRIGIAGLISSAPLAFGERGTPITNDSVQCWYNGSSNAATPAGNVLVSGVNRNGRSCVTYYNTTTKTGELTELSTTQQDDDHNNPSIVALADGTMLAAYSMHSTDPYIRLRKSTIAEPTTSAHWGSETTITTGGQSSYAQLHKTSDGTIYLVNRSAVDGWTYRKSTDNGTTWSAGILLHKGLSATRDAYTVTAIDAARNRLHVHYTDSRASAANTSVGHYYVDLADNKAYTMAGALICDLDVTWVDLTALTHLYSYSASALSGGETQNDRLPSVRSWCYDVAIDAATGFPTVAYHAYAINNWSSRTSTDRIYAYVAHWTGSAWSKKLIANTGYGIASIEPGYSGGIAIDKSDTSKIYVSSCMADPFDCPNVLSDSGTLPATPRFELYRCNREGVLTGYVTKLSERDQIRPAFGAILTWHDGFYTGYGNVGMRLRTI